MGALTIEYPEYEKIKIDLYIESLCPFSMRLMAGSFAQAIKYPEFFEMAEVNIYPYGNTIAFQRDGQWRFICQHGENECVGNKVLQCALKKLPEEQSNELIACIMNYGILDIVRAGQTCATRLEIPFDEVDQCSQDSEGDELNLEYKDLSRGVQYTPFIKVNDVHNKKVEAQVRKNMIKFACYNYNGELPDLCSDEAVLRVINI